MISAERIAALAGHQNPIYTTEGLFHRNTFLTAGNDKGVVEWDLESFQPTVVLPVRSSVYSLHSPVGSDLFYAGERSGQLDSYRPNDPVSREARTDHALPIFDIKSVERKKELLTASEDGNVNVYDLNNLSLLYSFSVSPQTVRCIAISGDEQLVAFGCKDNIIRVYDLNDYQLIKELHGHSLPVTSVQFSPDGQFLLSGGRDARLNIWNTADFSLKETIIAHLFAVYDIKFHPSKPYFATCSRDKSIKIWSSDTFTLKKTISREKGIEGHSLSVNKILWVPNYEYLISVSDDKLVLIWRIDL